VLKSLVMTKEELTRFGENWAAVNEITIEEERRKTPAERLRELQQLYDFGQAVGWPKSREADVEAVRERWEILREKYDEQRRANR